MYENKNMDRFQVYENKSGNNFDETAQEKLIWFLKSFIQQNMAEIEDNYFWTRPRFIFMWYI